MIYQHYKKFRNAVFNKEILREYEIKTYSCLCRRESWIPDKVIVLNVKTASFKIRSKCLKKISDTLYKKSIQNDVVSLKTYDERVIKKALRIALNPKKYENQPLSRETRFNVIRFAAKFNFPTKTTEKMLHPGIYVKLIEYAGDTDNLYLIDLLPKAFDNFPEVERYPEFLKVAERRRNKFLAARDANRKKIAVANSAMEKAKSNKQILKEVKSYDCFCRNNPEISDKVIILKAKNASFQVHSECLKKTSNILFMQSESTETIKIKKFDQHVVKKALKFALNPKKYYYLPISRETRFNMVKFAAKYEFSKHTTYWMLKPGIYVKLIEYSFNTDNAYLLKLLPETFHFFPEVERYPEFLKIAERKRIAFLAKRDRYQTALAKVMKKKKLATQKFDIGLLVVVILLNLNILSFCFFNFSQFFSPPSRSVIFVCIFHIVLMAFFFMNFFKRF